MLEKVDRGDCYWIYEVYDNGGFREETLRNVVIKDGYSLWTVTAAYLKHKSITPSKYYVIAKDKKSAKKKFNKAFSWIEYIVSVEATEEDLSKKVLRDKYSYCLI